MKSEVLWLPSIESESVALPSPGTGEPFGLTGSGVSEYNSEKRPASSISSELLVFVE